MNFPRPAREIPAARGFMARLIALTPIALTAITTAARGEASPAAQPIRLFIVAGQSNAEGHNHIRQYHGGRETFPAPLQEQPDRTVRRRRLGGVAVDRARRA